MADFWGGFGKGFAPAYETAFTSAERRRERKEEREEEIERVAKLSAQQRLRDNLKKREEETAQIKAFDAMGVSGMIPEGRELPVSRDRRALPYQGFFPEEAVERTSPDEALSELSDIDRMSLAMQGPYKYKKKEAVAKAKQDRIDADLKLRADREWQMFTKGVDWNRADRVKNETLRNVAEKDSSELSGYLSVLTGDPRPEWIMPSSIGEMYFTTGMGRARRDLDKEGRDTEAAKQVLLDKVKSDRRNVEKQFGTQIEGLYAKVYGGRIPSDTKQAVLTDWTDARKERDRLLNLMDLQSQYQHIFSKKGGKFARKELVDVAQGLGYESVLDRDIASNEVELVRAIDEIYGAFDDKQKAASTGADVPYKYTSGYDRDGKTTFRTWVLKDDADPALMLPSEQYRKTGKPTDSVSDRWIQRANAGLRIEAMRFGEDQEKGIPIREITAMDVWHSYGRGEGSSIKERVKPRSKPPKEADEGVRDTTPIEDMLPPAPAKDIAVPPLPDGEGIAMPPLPVAEPHETPVKLPEGSSHKVSGGKVIITDKDGREIEYGLNKDLKHGGRTFRIIERDGKLYQINLFNK